MNSFYPFHAAPPYSMTEVMKLAASGNVFYVSVPWLLLLNFTNGSGLNTISVRIPRALPSGTFPAGYALPMQATAGNFNLDSFVIAMGNFSLLKWPK